MTVVIDASALFAAIIPGSPHSEWAWEICRTHDLVAPELLSVEMAQALRRTVRAGVLREEDAAEALAQTSSLVTQYFPHAPLLRSMWQMRDNLSAYDATYASLATRLQIPLVTLDSGLARGAPETCKVWSRK